MLGAGLASRGVFLRSRCVAWWVVFVGRGFHVDWLNPRSEEDAPTNNFYVMLHVTRTVWAMVLWNYVQPNPWGIFLQVNLRVCRICIFLRVTYLWGMFPYQVGPYTSYKWSHNHYKHGYNPSYPSLRPFNGLYKTQHFWLDLQGPPCNNFPRSWSQLSLIFDPTLPGSHKRWAVSGNPTVSLFRIPRGNRKIPGGIQFPAHAVFFRIPWRGWESLKD